MKYLCKVIFLTLVPLYISHSASAMEEREKHDKNNVFSPVAFSGFLHTRLPLLHPPFLQTNQYFFNQDEDIPAVADFDLPEESEIPQIEQEANSIVNAEGQLGEHTIPSYEEINNLIQDNFEQNASHPEETVRQALDKPAKHIITESYQQVEINSQSALELFNLGFPIIYVFKPHPTQLTSSSILLAKTREEVEHFANSPLFMLVTILRSNNASPETSDARINLRKVFLRLSQIGTIMANTYGNNIFRIAQQVGSKSRLMQSVMLKISEWNRFAQTIALLRSDLSTAYIIYTNLLGLHIEKLVNQDNNALISIMNDEHIFVNFMLDMLRPYANAWLLSQNQTKKTKLKLFQPINYDRTLLPGVIERYSAEFQKIIKGRTEALEKYSAEAKKPSVKQPEQPKKQPKKRPSKKSRKRQNKNKNNAPQTSVITSTGSDITTQSAGMAPSHRIQGTISSSPEAPSLSTPQELIASTLVSRAPIMNEVVEIEHLSSQTDDETEEKESSITKWKQEVALRRAEAIKERANRRRIIGAAYKKEVEEKEQKCQQERQKRGYKLLALLPTESERFISYLDEVRFTENPLYQTLLDPTTRTQKVTQDALDDFFCKLCDHLRVFLNRENIGNATERTNFADDLQNDLLTSRHNLHDPSEGENLPNNYITHRRGPIIYGGLIPLRLMRKVGNDNRQSIEHYNFRLLSRSLIAAPTKK